MANDEVEVFNNQLKNNATANLSIISYKATMTKYDDPEYDPYPETIFVHDNTFEGGGDNPAGALGTLAAPLVGGVLPDIVYDGWLNPDKAVDGALPAEFQVYFQNNGDADFVKLNLAEGVLAPEVSQEISEHEGAHQPLPAIVIAGVEGSD